MMARQNIRIILKSGKEFVVVCDEFTCKYSGVTGGLASCKYEGATQNIPLYLDMDQIAAILQEKIESDEKRTHDAEDTL